jgi:hypothetical protein
LHAWDERIAFADRSARTLLSVIEQDPEAIVKALAKTYVPLAPAWPDSRS